MPVPISRILTLLFIPYYLFVLSALLVTNYPDVEPAFAFMGVYFGAVAVCVLLAVWSQNFVGNEVSNSKRFSISSMMIVTGILAIHMAYFRLIVTADQSQIRLNAWVLFNLAFLFVIFCSFSTIVLAMFTDAVLDEAVRLKRIIAGLFDNDE